MARAAGIPAYEIMEVNREARSITMTDLSIAIVSHKRDQAALEWVIFSPTITDYQVSLDASWLAKHSEAPRGQKIAAIISQARFLDAYGNERTSTRKLVQALCKSSDRQDKRGLRSNFQTQHTCAVSLKDRAEMAIPSVI